MFHTGDFGFDEECERMHHYMWLRITAAENPISNKVASFTHYVKFLVFECFDATISPVFSANFYTHYLLTIYPSPLRSGNPAFALLQACTVFGLNY